MTTFGTSNFVSREKAIRYYGRMMARVDWKAAERLVEEKLATGEIHIGPPRQRLKGDTLVTLDDGARYGLKTADKENAND